MNCGCNELPDTAMMHLIAFGQQKLIEHRVVVQQHWRKALSVLHDLEKCHNYCFSKKIQTNGGNDQQEFNNTMAVVTVHCAVHAPV